MVHATPSARSIAPPVSTCCGERQWMLSLIRRGTLRGTYLDLPTPFRHRPLALSGYHWLSVNQRSRCQHAIFLSQVTGRHHCTAVRRTPRGRSFSLYNRLPPTTYVCSRLTTTSTNRPLTDNIPLFDGGETRSTPSLLSSSFSSLFQVISYISNPIFNWPRPPPSLNMLPSGKRKADAFSCTSAARVTAKLALSFLALTTTPLVNAFSYEEPNAQIVLPIDASPIKPLLPEPPAPAEHKFVRPVCFCHQEAATNTDSPPIDTPTHLPPRYLRTSDTAPQKGCTRTERRRMASGRR